MRRPTVAKVLGMKSGLGLSEYCQKVQPKRSDRCSSESTNLSIITSGSIPTNPSELLASEEFKHLILHAKESYDFVLVDCPPCWPLCRPACRIWSRGCSDRCHSCQSHKVVPSCGERLKCSNGSEREFLGTVVNASVLEVGSRLLWRLPTWLRLRFLWIEETCPTSKEFPRRGRNREAGCTEVELPSIDCHLQDLGRKALPAIAR